jgi:prophage maintenance system killer protein/predicted transcriptional regulator
MSAISEVTTWVKGTTMNNAIEIYLSSTGEIRLDVVLEHGSVWLSQKQIAELFGTGIPAISKHIKNIINQKELETESTISKMEIVQKEGKRRIKRQLETYNLDMIISIGYRVNSLRATHFRQWATSTLKHHLIKGFTLNQKRLETLGTDMGLLMDLVQKTLIRHEPADEKGSPLTKLIADYTHSWTLLKAYDEQTLTEPLAGPGQPQPLEEVEVIRAIGQLKKELIQQGEATQLFGQLMGNGLSSALGAIEQTFDGHPLYPTINSRAAHLLYFIIKNHPFTDGNKRIGSFLFLLYLEFNKASRNQNGSPKISDNAIVPLALLIAESNPKHKELVIRLIQHLLDKGVHNHQVSFDGCPTA